MHSCEYMACHSVGQPLFHFNVFLKSQILKIGKIITLTPMHSKILKLCRKYIWTIKVQAVKYTWHCIWKSKLPVAGMCGIRNSDPIIESTVRLLLLVTWGILLIPSWISSGSATDGATTSPIPDSMCPAWISARIASTRPSPWCTNDEQAAERYKSNRC